MSLISIYLLAPFHSHAKFLLTSTKVNGNFASWMEILLFVQAAGREGFPVYDLNCTKHHWHISTGHQWYHWHEVSSQHKAQMIRPIAPETTCSSHWCHSKDTALAASSPTDNWAAFFLRQLDSSNHLLHSTFTVFILGIFTSAKEVMFFCFLFFVVFFAFWQDYSQNIGWISIKLGNPWHFSVNLVKGENSGF